MLRLALTGHYGRTVELDLCAPCHLVWFDAVESARLPGTALLVLLGAMAHAQRVPHHALRDQAACPRCHGALKRVNNRTRWGKSLQLECRAGHGAWQTFAQFLSEKGLVRAVSSADRARLLAADRHCACLNCGAPLAPAQGACGFCGAQPGLFDVAQMARAFDPDDVAAGAAVRQMASRREAFDCHACGAAAAHLPALQCEQCRATLACTDLPSAYAVLRELEPALLAHQQRPAPQVVTARLDRLTQDLPRRREWLREMQKEQGVAPETTFWASLIALLTRRVD